MSDLLGFLVVYIGVIIIIPFLLFKYTPFSIFITWFANVDIVSNILSINYPQYFKQVYDITPETLTQYLSYNIISLVALTGIFIHGLRSQESNKLKTLLKMIIMSIVTWTLPTQGIPLMNNRIDNYIKKQNKSLDEDSFKREKLLITIVVSSLFIFVEWLIIHFFIDKIGFSPKLPNLLKDLL